MTTRYVERLAAALIGEERLGGCGADERRRLLLLLAFIMVAVVLVLVSALVRLALGAYEVAALTLAGATLLVAIPLAGLRWSSVAAGAHGMTATWTAATLVLMVDGGGVEAPEAMAMVVPPLLALLLAGRRAGLLWISVTTVSIVAMTLAMPQPTMHFRLEAMNLVLFVAVVFGLALAYDALERAALDDATAALEAKEEARAEQARAEQARTEAEHRALVARTARLAELGTLAAGVAHEINNPLAFIQANLEVLMHDGLPAEERSEAMRDALEGAERIRAIVHDISVFGRLDESNEVEVVDVRAACEDAIKLVRGHVFARASLDLSTVTAPLVLAQEGQLTQVLVNLLTNAAQAIPDDRRGAIEVEVREEAGRVRVEVRDDGTGIDPAVGDQIFNPFFTTKPVGKGTGLGLSISNTITEQLGGKLRLDPRPGGGTVATMTLPSAPPDRRAERPSTRPPSPPSPIADSKPARILVIDDDIRFARALRRLLGHHDVTVAHSGEDALSCIAEERFDVILCDVMMPDVDGADVYEHLARELPDEATRLVFVTGGACNERTRRLLRETVLPVLEKPVDSDALEQVIAARRPRP